MTILRGGVGLWHNIWIVPKHKQVKENNIHHSMSQLLPIKVQSISKKQFEMGLGEIYNTLLCSMQKYATK